VERRPSPPCGGPHGRGNDMLKVGGVVHHWGCSVVRSPRQRGGVVSSTVVLGAQPLSWRWIGACFEACRSSTALAVYLGGVAGGQTSRWMFMLLGQASSVSSLFLCGRVGCRRQRSGRGGFRSASVMSLVEGLGGGGAVHCPSLACVW
jgi:hypothetical protein